MKSCILILDKEKSMSDPALLYAKTLFDVKHIFITKKGVNFTDYLKTEWSISENLDIMLKADYIFNFLSEPKIPKEVLDCVETPINFHPAPPEYPGVGGASYALYNNNKNYGATAHIMTDKYDSGKILKVLRFPISEQDYCDTLFDRACYYSLILFYDVLNLIADAKPLLCGEDWVGTAKTKKDFQRFLEVQHNDSQTNINRKVRSTIHNKYPGAYVQFRGFKFGLGTRETNQK